MGWQSYIIGYNTPVERRRILDVITAHNAHTDFDAVGEELYQICEADVIKVFPYGSLKNKIHVVLCGHGGGRGLTYEWFLKHGLDVRGFEGQDKEHLSELRDIAL